MAKSNRTPEPILPKGKVLINTSATPVTGRGGKMGTMMATLGPTIPVSIHEHVRRHTNPKTHTPNPHVAELHRPGVGVKNTPTKKGK
jgi:hypothetical protein